MLQDLQEPARELRQKFERAIDAHRSSLWRFCLKLTGSPWDAEDLVQETMLKALAKLHRFGQALEPRSYLFRIASNTWIDHCRRRRPFADIDGIEEAEFGVEEGRGPEQLSAIQELLRMLPPRQRVVYLLVEAFDFTPSDAAAMLRTTEGAVKAMLHRARAAVRRVPPGGESRGVERDVPSRSRVLHAYLDAFNRRDMEALAALFDRDATTEIVGDWEEHGVETMRKYSLAFWAAEQVAERAELSHAAGRDAVLVFRRQPDGTEALSSAIVLDVVDDRITSQRWYFFCPELLGDLATNLGVPSLNHGYRYEPGTEVSPA